MADIHNILEFLNNIRDNNNRQWFKKHKEEFDIIREQFIEYIQQIIDEMSVYDISLRGLNAKDCVYRIYRDIRFSPNKAPYKTHLGALIGKGGRKCPLSCYYLHIEPGNCGLHGGLWCPEPRLLHALRHDINDNIEEWEEILNAKELKSRYTLVGDSLKTAPKGFDKNLPHIQYIKMKEYLLSFNVPDSYFDDENWCKKVASDFRPMLDFHRFINFTIQENL